MTGTIALLQAAVFLVALIAMDYLREFDHSSFDLGPSPQAVTRESELLAISDIEALGRLDLLDVSSSPGQPTPWTYSAHAIRRYRYLDGQSTVCQRTVEELTARGVVFDDEARCTARPVDNQMSETGRINCGSYEVSVRVNVESPTNSWEDHRSTVYVRLEAPYPGMGPGHTMPELDPVDCSRPVEVEAG